jgi:hypothetical protein
MSKGIDILVHKMKEVTSDKNRSLAEREFYRQLAEFSGVPAKVLGKDDDRDTTK